MSMRYWRKTVEFLFPLCAGLLLALLAPAKADAQVLYGSIVGHVTDPSGAAVPGATVTITNPDTNQSRETTTDPAGDYTLTAVQTGTYKFRVSQQGFKVFERTGISVMLNSIARVDVGLEVGALTQTVTVSAEAPPLQTDRAEVRAALVSKELGDLPVPLGRNYQQVFRTLPGFSPPVNSHSIPTNPARSLEFNVNGTSDDQNTTRIDGVSTYNVQLPHVASYIPSLESIQEINIVTNSFDAEQGLAGGAAINVQTKSGTNEIHGSLFEYHSNQHLKAQPDFTPAGVVKGKLVYNQFGGTVGGPIKKDKVFYFVSYEGSYDRRIAQTRRRIPTPAMRQGDFSASSTPIYDPLTGNPVDATGRVQFVSFPSDNAACTDPAGCPNIIPTNRLDSIALKIADLIPDPNFPASNNYFASAPFTFDRNTIDSKFNWNPTQKLTTFYRFSYLHYTSFSRQLFGDELGGRTVRAGSGTSNPGRGHGNTYVLAGGFTYSFTPRFLMDAYLGYARQDTSSEQPRLDENVGLDFLGIPGTNGTRKFEGGWPEFDFDGFETLGIDNNFMPYYRKDPQYQYVANFNWTKGTHNIRFGTDLYRMGLNHTQAEFLSGAYGAQGGFNFGRGTTQRCEVANPDGTCDTVSDDSRSNSFASFMLGLPDFVGKTLQVPDVYHVRAWLYSFYARDRWNVTPKLTLDYGIRWEYFPVPTRPDRGIERYDPETNKVLVCGIGSVPKNCGIEISKKRFAPRLGLAYRATNTFVIRAGYGITNDPYEAMELLRANYPLLLVRNIVDPRGGLFPAGSLSQGIPPIPIPDLGDGVIDIPGDYGFGGLPKKPQRGYIQSWNFTIQKELKYGFTGQVGYVATRSIRQLGFLDHNAGQVIGAGNQGRPLYARFGRDAATIALVPVGTGHYDSLQATLQRRFSQGLALTLNYTWGKAINSIDNSSATLGVDGGKIAALKYWHLNRSVTGFDRTHNLGMTSIWELPFGNGRRWLSNRGALSHVVGGWQVNNILSVISGPPFTVYADDSSLNLPGSTQRADQVKANVTKLGGIGEGNPFYDPAAFADVTEARFGTAGFNILRGPGIVNWDFGLFRQVSLSERLKLQIRIESFNFSNTPHFTTPGDGYTCACDSVEDGFMIIDSVTNLAREGIDERQFRFGLRLTF